VIDHIIRGFSANGVSVSFRSVCGLVDSVARDERDWGSVLQSPVFVAVSFVVSAISFEAGERSVGTTGLVRLLGVLLVEL